MNHILKSITKLRFVWIVFSSLFIYSTLVYTSIYTPFFSDFFLPNDLVDNIRENNLLLFLQKPFLFILAISICFCLEAILLKGKNTSFEAIFNLKSATARTDVFYMWLKVSGLSDLILNLIFLGFGFYLISIMQTKSIFTIDNYFFQIVIMFVFGTFIQYWYHRLMHSKYFWELHKLHHSATEMNMLTVAREHPFVVSVSVLLLALPAYIFGIHIEIIFIYSAVTGIHNLFVHSKVNIIPQWLTFILIDTKYHYLHHSSDNSHLNRNFGDLFNVWDKLFETHLKPNKDAKFNLGITENKDFNKDVYFTEIFNVFFRWLRFLRN